MNKKYCLIILFLCLFQSVKLISQEQATDDNKWSFTLSIEPMLMNIKGNDVQLGDYIKIEKNM